MFDIRTHLKKAPSILKDALHGFYHGIKLGRAYLKSLGSSDYPIKKIDESAHVDLEAYHTKPAYRKGAHVGVDSTKLTKDLGNYIVEGYTYDTGPTAAEVQKHDSLKKK